jgi:hypothetical protein
MMTVEDLNAALGIVEPPTELLKGLPVGIFETQPTCDNSFSCSFTINCGSDTGATCVCHGC